MIKGKFEEPTYGFWGYDRFPYCLGAVVTEYKVDDKGNVRVHAPAYGQGTYFAAKVMRPAEEGKVAHDKLEKLEAQYRKELDELAKKYRYEALKIAPWLKGFPQYGNLK